MYLRDLFARLEDYVGKEVEIKGWIRNHRKQKKIGFIDVYDGTIFQSIQLVYESVVESFETIQTFKIGSSIQAICLIQKIGDKRYDFIVKEISLVGDCDADYPIQPKNHTMEFLREEAHLRARTNIFRAVFRIRNTVSMAVHSYFQSKGFLYITTPLITITDCEGTDQMFKVSSFDFLHPPIKEDGSIDSSKDLFGKQAYITGTGQLHGEAFAMAFTNIYTFGPTFRTEKSNTKIHANEFWMIEPEMSFCDLEQLMDVEEDALKYIIKTTLKQSYDELTFLDQFVEKGLIEKLETVVQSTSLKISYQEAIDILKKATKKWEFQPVYGEDLAKEHERYLAEEYFKSPLFITDWPKDMKPFYCKLNPDGKTVAAVDYILPKCGELSSGSSREDDYERLLKRMNELEIDKEQVKWYLDLRRFGTTKRAGFGFGFERLLIYITGMDNIRDVIPFPRTPNSCHF